MKNSTFSFFDKPYSKTFFLLFVFLISGNNCYTQNYPIYAGPSLFSEMKYVQEPAQFQIGTRYFALMSVSPNFQFGRGFMESCTITNLGSPAALPSAGNLVYRNGVIYTWNQSSPFQIWRIDTVSGAYTIHLPSLSGVLQANLVGMHWDGVNMYGVSTSISSSQIFTINMSTGTCTPIGIPSTACQGAVNLFGRSFPGSSMYSADLVLDNLYRWNKTTGTATLIGPLGFNVTAGNVDVSYDNNDCYWVVNNQLRRTDTSFGNSTNLCTYSGTLAGFVCIPPTPPAGLTFCRNGLNILIAPLFNSRDSVNVWLGNGCTVTDLNVRIDTAAHTWVSDLRFYIMKGNVGSRIINWVGGSGDNFVGTNLDDEASIPIANGTPPFTGSFIPSSPLTPFDNTDPNGYWKLLITDTAGGDTGMLRAWCLVISYNCPTGGIHTIEVPNYYFLNQNHPNPFNPSTIIKFGIPETENVKLIVYDVLGREVKTLLNELKYPGTYVVDFDGTNLSSGIYFYKLETPNFVQVKKMLLVK